MDGAVVVLEKDSRFLLQLRDNKKGIECPNCWGMFGGGTKEGETPEDTAIREIEEELGLKLKRKKLKQIFETGEPGSKATVFQCQLEKEISDLILNEGQDMKLFTKKEIKRIKNLGTTTKKIFVELDLI